MILKNQIRPTMNDFFVIVCTCGSWQTINNEIIYVRPLITNFGLYFPADINKEGLIHLVKRKTGLDNSYIILSFQHPEQGYVMSIMDDSDLRHLKSIICSCNSVMHLFLVVEEQVVAEEANDGAPIY